MRNKKISLCLIVGIMAINIVGCSNKSMFDIVFGEGSNEIVGTMTQIEYAVKIDRLLADLFNDSETILANSKYVASGTRDTQEEYVLVESAISKVQNTIDEVDLLAEPKPYTDDKAELIINLTNYKNALMEYALALDEDDTVKIQEASSNVMVNMETLKSSAMIYQG